MTHTPGPWSAKRGHNATILGPNGETVGFLAFGSNVDDNANAALIAAAPEMLEALKVAKAIIDKDIDLTAVDYEQIAHAIAKAEGRA